jgi:hypothetical protein
MDEASLDGWSPGYSHHEITWPDGHRETAGFDNSLYATAYGPRLRVLNQYSLALLPWRKRGVMRAVGNQRYTDELARRSESLDGITSNRYAQDFAWRRPTHLDEAILNHFGERHGNL